MPDYRELESGKTRMRMHNIHIDNRSRVSITGVNDMESFHEQEAVLITEAGTLRIEGENMHLSKLNLDDGQVIIEGEIVALEYADYETERRGLLTRIFK